MKTSKRIMFNNILIMFLISALTACIMYIALNKTNGNEINQTQNVSISTVDDTKDKIDLNKATFEELKSLPYIGDKLATEIIDNRPYRSIYDLKKIKGIGDTVINNLKEKVIVNE